MDFDSDQILDWSHEREWRVKGDFAFEYDDIEILVKDDEYYRRFVKRCFEQDRKDIIEGVHGIVPLNTVIL